MASTPAPVEGPEVIRALCRRKLTRAQLWEKAAGPPWPPAPSRPAQVQGYGRSPRRNWPMDVPALHCRIVLACADGGSNVDVAAELGVNKVTVSKWRRRFAADRLEGLTDAPRPGAARRIGDDVVEAIVVETLETTPKDATHWSTRALAERHGISRQTVSEIWRAFGLKPWRQDEFKISPDPDLIEKIRDIVGLYLSPPVAAAVFAVDAAHHAGQGDPRLRAQRHPGPVRRPGDRHRQGDHRPAQVPHRRRLHRVLEQGQPRGPRRARRARHPG